MKISYLTMKNINTEPVIGSLLSTGRECEVLEYDKISNWPLIYNILLQHQPDVIVYNSVSAGASLPSIHILQRLSDIAPAVHICFDASCPDWHSLLEQYAKQDVFHKTINIDGNDDWPKREKDITWLCPIDPRPYQGSEWPFLRKRIINLGFRGGDGSQSRRDLLGKLGKLVINKGRSEAVGTYQDYASFLCNTKCVLNMPQSGSGRASQVKARVLETGLARSCLLEQKNGVTAKWFQPGIHYLEYETAEDIIAIMKEDDVYNMELIADNLHREVTTKYSAEIFWNMALE